MKRFAMVLLLFVFACSSPVVNVKMVRKGNYTNLECHKVKFVPFNGDNIGLKDNIYKALLAKGFLTGKNQNTCLISGTVNSKVDIKPYKKTVKVEYVNQPKCEYFASKCVAKDGIVFCSKPQKVSDKLYYYINNSYKNPQGYYLYKNKIYSIEQKCKPDKTVLNCQTALVSTTAILKVDKLSKIYTQTNTIDSCDGLDSVTYGKYNLDYKIPRNLIKQMQLEQSKNIASAFINDFFPHKFNLKIKLFKPESKSKDVSKFLDNLQAGNISNADLKKMLNHKNDLYLMYDVAVGYEVIGNFNRAEEIYEYILKHTSNVDLKEKVFEQLFYINQRQPSN